MTLTQPTFPTERSQPEGPTKKMRGIRAWSPEAVWNLHQIGTEGKLFVDFSLMRANKFLFCLSQFELDFLFSYNQMYAV